MDMSEKVYIAHKRNDGAIQFLFDHLWNVAKMSAQFGQHFGAEDQALCAGLLHDKGKYAADVQRRMYDPEHVAKVNHTTAGAKAALAMNDKCGAIAIACHHGGLRNFGSQKFDTVESGTFFAKLCYEPKDTSAFDREITSVPVCTEPQWCRQNNYSTSFYTRMLFSCLVDADFLDTEAFMQTNAIQRGSGDSMHILLGKLLRYLNGKGYLSGETKNEINLNRRDILKQCLRGGEYPQGLYSLTVPTGGGKTLSSLAFALAHAVTHGQRRVIYVIPYTSIIEQNAKVFEDVLGVDNVLQHHSHANLSESQDAEDREDEVVRRHQLTAENWDSPIVVTTAVQFFESLYGAKTSKCRKLHNISDAVVIFDEAQMMPCDYLEPCVCAIGELVKNYRVTAILCTATQPSLAPFFRANQYDEPKEIIENYRSLFQCFKRVTFERNGRIDTETVAQHLLSEPQALCIVNTRKKAREIYEAMNCEDKFYLTTLITPRDRGERIYEIRERLRAGMPCRVVSTSLIEAGVDVDFPTVWREEAGLDSILQAAGRCNREGKRDRESSIVHVFETGEKPPLMFDKQIKSMQIATENGEQVDAPETIKKYFDYLYRYVGQTQKSKQIMDDSRKMKFKTVDENFQLIDGQTMTVYIPDTHNASAITALEKGMISRTELKILQQDAVNIYKVHFDMLCGSGKIKCIQDGVGILEDTDIYSIETGLLMSNDVGTGLFI